MAEPTVIIFFLVNSILLDIQIYTDKNKSHCNPNVNNLIGLCEKNHILLIVKAEENYPSFH